MNFLSPIQHPLFKCHHHPMLLFAVCLCFAWVKSSLGCSSTLQPKVNLCGIGNDDDDILSLTSKNRQVSIKSQASPASHIHCDWKIFNQDPEYCLPMFKCDKFNMTVSPNCNQNYLEIVDTNDKVKLKFCGFSNHLEYKLKDKVYLEVKVVQWTPIATLIVKSFVKQKSLKTFQPCQPLKEVRIVIRNVDNQSGL